MKFSLQNFDKIDMSVFDYKARTKEGEERAGVIETSSREAALDNLQQRGLVITSIRERQSSLWEIRLPFGQRVKQKDIIIFSRQLSTLFEARIPVVQSLRTLAAETQNPVLKTAISDMMDDIGGGASLSQALSQHPQVFSSFYINLVRSGEESGKLQEVFLYLADYLERVYYLITKARNSMIYPAVVFVVFIGVIVVMLVTVIPSLVSIFEDTGQDIPFYTQIVVFMSVVLRSYGIPLVILLGAGVVGVWRWYGTSRGKLFFHSLQLHSPIIGEIYRKIYMAQFADNLQTLIMSGIPILRALSITGNVISNVVYKKAIRDAIERVRGGGSISDALEECSEIPPLVTQMVRVGEASGRLDFILGTIAKFYRREVDSVLENLVALIEPVLIVFLGAGVGLLMAAVLIPLYSLVGNI
jgi:type IV pilus assembly protein PilC